MYGDGLVGLALLVAGHVEHVLVLDGHVGRAALKDAADVDAHHLERAVGARAVHDGMLADGLLGQSAGSLDERLDGADVAARLVHARTEDGADDLHHVLIAHDGGVDRNRVLVHHLEVVHVKLADVKHRVLSAGLAVNADRLREGVAGESAGIAQQRGGALGLLHLVVHGALHLAGDAHQRLVGADGDDVVVLQADVARQLAVQQEGVDVDARNLAPATEHLHRAQRADVVGAARHVECVVDGGEGRHGVGAGHLHLAGDADGDGARLADGQLYLRALIARTDDLAQAALGLTHRQSAQLDQAYTLDGDGAVRRDGL